MRPDLDAFSKFEHEAWQRVATKYEDSWSALTRAFIAHLGYQRVPNGQRRHSESM
jgi:hypothetical protein